MDIAFILGTSILLQFTAAFLSLRLIRITGGRIAWILIAAALSLMAIRRCITLFRLIAGDLSYPPDPTVELIALAISILFASGIGWIAPLFLSIRDYEKRIASLNRVYSVLSRLNQAIVRIRDRDQLFEEACRIAVEHGLFRMAWIGVIETDTLLVKPVASYGFDEGYLDNIRISVSDIPEGRGPTGTAIREGMPFVCRDIENDPRMLPWHDEALKCGYRSSAAFPIRVKDCVIGVFNIYAIEPHFFNDEEIKLFEDLSADISFALGSMEQENLHRRTEEELRKLRKAVEASGEVIFLTDREGIITFINPEFTMLYGFSEDEVVGKVTPRILKSGKMRQENYEIFWKTILNKQIVKGELINKTKDGRLLNIESSANPILDENGNITGFLAIQRDITDRKHLEDQLRQSQKMEAVGQLAGGIAHDFNNILTAIIGYASFLQEGIKEDDPLIADVNQILASAERAANLTRGLLAFSRKQIIAPKPVRLNEVIKKIEKFLLRIIGEDIELKAILADTDLTVMADSNQIEQVLMNLAANARDAMPDGGILTISTDLIKLDNEFINAHGFGIKGMYALISAADTGNGIDEKTKERIFEPFFTTKELGRGTGLGLSIVYGIIKQHDGYINVYSELGKGTTFKIYLPAIKSEVEEMQTTTLPPPKGGTETILIAEDNEDVRRLTGNILERFGYKVIEAVNGEDAVEIFNKNKGTIRLLILDVIMPKKNGREAYEEIKKIQPDIEAVFMSGYIGDILDKKGIIDKEINFVSKPVSPNELLRKVREVLDK